MIMTSFAYSATNAALTDLCLIDIEMKNNSFCSKVFRFILIDNDSF